MRARRTQKVTRADIPTASKARVVRESAASVRRRAAAKKPAAKLIAMLMYLHGDMVSQRYAAVSIPIEGFHGTTFMRFTVEDVVAALRKAGQVGK